jgi:hypothetical protein
MAGLAIKPSIAMIGAAIGAAAIVVPHSLAVGIWPLLLLYAGLVVVAYIVGAITVGNAAGEIFRGLLIGANAAMNWALAAIVYPTMLGEPAGTIVAVVLGVLSFAATFGFLSHTRLYQALLGYINWFLPLSWPIVALGLAFFLLGLLGALGAGLPGVAFFKISRVVFDWRTGTLFTRGGWISNLNPIDTAFNMGNFAFVDAKFDEMAIEHESGHTLNLAAFGGLFHLIGTLDENLINGENALSERLAESHVPNSARPLLGMWA